MNNSATLEQNEDMICYCSGTTMEKIKQLVDSGTRDLEKISELTGACMGCGSCEDEVVEYLASLEAVSDSF